MTDNQWSAHPGAPVLGCYVDGTLTREERDATAAHLAGCPDCRLVVRETSRVLARRRRRRYTVAGIGVATLAAATVASLVMSPRVVQQRLTRGLDASGPTIHVIAPVGDVVAGQPVTFRWNSVGPEIRYRLSVATPDGSEVWRVSVTDTTATLPDRVALTRGRTYVWFVDALLADGRSATTGLRRLIVEP